MENKPPSSIKVPFDSVVLAAVTEELQPFVGGLVQAIQQPEEFEVLLQIYKGDIGQGVFLLSCHPQFFRAHFVTRRRSNSPTPPTFLATLRARLMNSTLESAVQVAHDRILRLEFSSETQRHVLIAELMGKHSNLILCEGKRIVAAAKWVRPDQSRRPIVSGQAYQSPPVQGDSEGSPLWKKLRAAGPLVVGPVYSAGHGAYPYSLAPLGLPEVPRKTLSIALEQHYDHAVPASRYEDLRRHLLTDLERVILAREVALQDLKQAVESGSKAEESQRKAELILAYGHSLPIGASLLEAYDYEGNPVTIKLDASLDFKENAEKMFAKSRNAKKRLPLMLDQCARLEAELGELSGLLSQAQSAPAGPAIEELFNFAKGRRWLMSRDGPKKVEDRPYQGYRIRELIGPGGVMVLYGENAESNDYLTLRVAKPNDYWLHVRGSTSAHVVVPTRNRPDLVSREVLEFAAKVALAHSTSKHSSLVPVDFTLKKYVRKPRGAAKGTALYTHEKTLHVSAS